MTNYLWRILKMLKYGVFSCSGAIGVSGRSLVKSFDKKEDAKKSCQGYNRVLTQSEKKYFGMKYEVKIFRVVCD